MPIRWTLLIAPMLLCCAAGAASAEEQPWYSNIMPWGQPSGPPTSKPGLGTRIIKAPQNLVGGARKRLPWRKSTPKKSNAFVDGTGKFFRPDLFHQQQQEQSRFGWVRPASWFESQPPPRQPQSMSDWIGLDRPGID